MGQPEVFALRAHRVAEPAQVRAVGGKIVKERGGPSGKGAVPALPYADGVPSVFPYIIFVGPLGGDRSLLRFIDAVPGHQGEDSLVVEHRLIGLYLIRREGRHHIGSGADGTGTAAGRDPVLAGIFALRHKDPSGDPDDGPFCLLVNKRFVIQVQIPVLGIVPACGDLPDTVAVLAKILRHPGVGDIFFDLLLRI